MKFLIIQISTNFGDKKSLIGTLLCKINLILFGGKYFFTLLQIKYDEDSDSVKKIDFQGNKRQENLDKYFIVLKNKACPNL